MRNSPAKAHFLRLSAATMVAGPGSTSNDSVGANQYELMLLKLAEDRRRLKDVQSIERKAEVKRALLPEYDPWIEGVIEGDTGQQDDVIVTCMIWSIDVGDFAKALRLASYVLGYKLALPDQYQRQPACLIAEEFAEAALRLKDGIDADTLNHLLSAEFLTANEDMPDEVRAKLLKAIGYGMERAGQLPQALEFLRRALSLHDKVGVKKDIERIERNIKNSSGSTGDPA